MDKKVAYEAYMKTTHRLGRIVSVLTLILLLGAPFVIGSLLGTMPDLGAAARGFLSVGLVWTVSSIVEYLVYTPMLGAGGSYLAFITGNLINMKIPCSPPSRTLCLPFSAPWPINTSARISALRWFPCVSCPCCLCLFRP